jgi:hypothetical protein
MPAGAASAAFAASNARCASDHAASGTSAGAAGHSMAAAGVPVTRGTISRSMPVLMIQAGASSKNISGKSISAVTSTCARYGAT